MWGQLRSQVAGLQCGDSTGFVSDMKEMDGARVRFTTALLFLLALLNPTQAQTKSQALNLTQLLDAASVSYPALLAARIEARASQQDVQAAERSRWPTLTATVESSGGHARSTPTRALQMDQTLWDAGRNTARISEAEVLAAIGQIKVQLQQQDLFVQVVSAWQNLIASSERAKAAQITMERLRGFQTQMRNRVLAEASASIELELVEARLLQTQVELTSAQSGLQVATSRLEQLTGELHLALRVPQAVYPLSLGETVAFDAQLTDTDWRLLATEHAVAAKARLEVVQMHHRREAKRAESFPQVFLRVYKPLGTLPTNAETSASAFVGLRYTPGAGFAHLLEEQALATRLSASEQNVESAIREMQQTFQIDREEFVNARARIAALEKAVIGSGRVLDSYQRQFKAGRKQWLDLLNQARELAQNQYALADAQASMVGAMHRLQIRMGRAP